MLCLNKYFQLSSSTCVSSRDSLLSTLWFYYCPWYGPRAFNWKYDIFMLWYYDEEMGRTHYRVLQRFRSSHQKTKPIPLAMILVVARKKTCGLENIIFIAWKYIILISFSTVDEPTLVSPLAVTLAEVTTGYSFSQTFLGSNVRFDLRERFEPWQQKVGYKP